MNPSKKILICALTSILSLLSLFLFRTKSQSQLWKDYNLLYVKSEKLSEENILQVLEKNGCRNVVSSVNQKIPVISPLAPVQVERANSYIFKRNAFFTDSTSSYSLFYVPQKFLTQLEKSILEINSYPDSFSSTDSVALNFTVAPFIVFLFFAVLFYFSKKRRYFVISSIPFILFSFFRPFFTGAGASLLALFAFFLCENFFDRKDFFKLNKNIIFISSLLFLPSIFLSFSSFSNSFFYLICILSAISLLLLYNELKKLFYEYSKIDKETEFNFVYIKSSSRINLFSSKGKNHTLLLAIPLVIVFLLFFYKVLNFNFAINENSNRPLLPSPVSKIQKNSVLPNLEDFMNWSWIKLSFPYRKLNESEMPYEVKRGDKVEIINFEENSDGIFEKVETVLTYDSSFASTIYDKVERLEYPALEKVMLHQGKNSYYDYTERSGKSSEKSAVLVLIFMAFIPLAVWFYCLSGKLKNGSSL